MGPAAAGTSGSRGASAARAARRPATQRAWLESAALAARAHCNPQRAVLAAGGLRAKSAETAAGFFVVGCEAAEIGQIGDDIRMESVPGEIIRPRLRQNGVFQKRDDVL